MAANLFYSAQQRQGGSAKAIKIGFSVNMENNSVASPKLPAQGAAIMSQAFAATSRCTEVQPAKSLLIGVPATWAAPGRQLRPAAGVAAQLAGKRGKRKGLHRSTLR